MNEFEIKIIMNVIIGFIVVIGFFVFWGRNSGVFKEGGFIYEFFKSMKNKKHDEKTNKKQ